MRYDMKEMFQQKSFLVSPESAGAKKKFFSIARIRWSEKKVFWRCSNPLERKKSFLASPESAGAKKKFFSIARIRWSKKKFFI